MLFLPYKLDHSKNGIALFTLLIIATCIFVFVDQIESDKQYSVKLAQYCSDLPREHKAFVRDFLIDGDPATCSNLFEKIRAAESPKKELQLLATEAPSINLFSSPEANLAYTQNKLEELYASFETTVPEKLTTNLAYDPTNIDWVKMLTSTVAHADMAHLIGNLLFFYIFSAAVELLMGSVLYLLFFATATITTNLAYTFATSGMTDALPTVGLSGIVMGTLAALAIMAPFARIKCFIWFLLLFKTFTLPALFIATWYIGWDLYEMKRLGQDSTTNYVAHISGAVTGAFFALIIVLAKRTRKTKKT